MAAAAFDGLLIIVAHFRG